MVACLDIDDSISPVRLIMSSPGLNRQDIFLDDCDRNDFLELKRQGWDLNRIVNEVCHMLSVDPDDLHKGFW